MIFVFYCLGGLAVLWLIAFVTFRTAVRLGGSKVQAFDPSAWIIPPQLGAEVVRQPDGDLCISWEVGAPQVFIYSSLDPHNFSSAERVAIITDRKEIVLRSFDPRKRYYFRLDFVGGKRHGESLVVAERDLPLESVNNPRDIGGYRSIDGRMVRWGSVFRTGNLAHLNDRDMDYLEGLGINLVCDLRSTSRVEGFPDHLPPGAEYLHSAIYEEEFNRELYPLLLFRRHKLGESLGRGYQNWPETGARAYGRFFERLANPANFPLILHCTAGKDRAGIAVAILLSLLGVPDETIIADYSLSNRVFDDLYNEFVEDNLVGRLGIPNEDVKIMLAANPEWIQRTLAFIRDHYGGAAAYLHQATGLTQAAIDAIQKNLLTG